MAPYAVGPLSVCPVWMWRWYTVAEQLDASSPVYTIQPVVKPHWQPVVTRFDNRLNEHVEQWLFVQHGCQTVDNRLYRVYKHSTGCQTGCTTGWQPVVSCKRGFKMKLGMEIGVDPSHIVFDGDPAPPPPTERGTLFGPRLLWPNGRPSQQLLSSST